MKPELYRNSQNIMTTINIKSKKNINNTTNIDKSGIEDNSIRAKLQRVSNTKDINRTKTTAVTNYKPKTAIKEQRESNFGSNKDFIIKKDHTKIITKSRTVGPMISNVGSTRNTIGTSSIRQLKSSDKNEIIRERTNTKSKGKCVRKKMMFNKENRLVKRESQNTKGPENEIEK